MVHVTFDLDPKGLYDKNHDLRRCIEKDLERLFRMHFTNLSVLEPKKKEERTENNG